MTQKEKNTEKDRGIKYKSRFKEHDKSCFYSGIIGSVLLAIAVFLPFLNIPQIGRYSFYQWSFAGGTAIIILVIISLFFTFVRIFNGLLITSITSLLITIYSILIVKLSFPGIIIKMEREYGLEEEVAERLLESAQIQWGVVFLLAGAIILLKTALK